MRISDWSSDVCSSDLVGVQLHARLHAPEKIGRKREIAFGRPSVAHLANDRIDAEYLLNDDDGALGLARRIGEIGLKAASSVKRGETGHSCTAVSLHSV